MVWETLQKRRMNFLWQMIFHDFVARTSKGRQLAITPVLMVG